MFCTSTICASFIPGAVMRIDQITGHVFSDIGGMGRAFILEPLQHPGYMLNASMSSQRSPRRQRIQKVLSPKIVKARDLLGWSHDGACSQ